MKLGVFDNVVEVKETVTYGKIVEVKDEKYKSEEEYKPESDSEVSVVIDEKRRKGNREALFFDPENQHTRYNSKPLPSNLVVVEINERASETSTYQWLSRYQSVTSSSPFNKFLNKFKNGEFAPEIAEFGGVRYRFLRVGTNAKSKIVKQYNQFVIGNNFTIFRLGMNGSPNVDLGLNARSRAKHFPPPINKNYTIASLFWVNELLKSQKSW